MRKKLTGYISICLLLLLPILAQASEPRFVGLRDGQDSLILKSVNPINPSLDSWYVGIQSGIPFGFATFNSFGEDKTRLGYSAGLFGGYRFSPVLSLEAQAAWGSVGMSARDCCAAYWLGSDGNRYLAPALGMEGWGYGDLYNKVSTQRYGLQLNVDVLQLFSTNPERRWTLEVSPLLAAVGTKASIKTIEGDNRVMRGDNNWHFGVGGNLSAGYRISKNLLLGVYSGITWLSGNGMDGMPKHVHKENLIWESGLKLGWTFGKKKKSEPRFIGLKDNRIESIIPQPHTPGLPADPEEEPVTVEPIVTVEPAQPEQPKETENVTEAEAVTIEFPAIYFVFNSISIAPGETAKMQEILTLLRENPDLGITLTGWCDNRGSVAVNKRISIQRAVAVKAWLVKNGSVQAAYEPSARA